jgi:hypothetical protein
MRKEGVQMPGRWSDLKKKHLSPARIEKAEAAAEREALDMDLRALRLALGKTQAEVAALVDMTQSELSKFERREDHRLSMLRRYVEALGGRFKVIAEIGDTTVTLIEG